MAGIYITYLTIYSGNMLPPKYENGISPKFYIGSTSIERYNDGYSGSITSKKYKEIWNNELREHPELFDVIILTEHETRKEAIEQELQYQIQKDVVHNSEFVNMSFAVPNGYFGMPMKGLRCGKNNGMFGKKFQGENHYNKGNLYSIGRFWTQSQREKYSENRIGKSQPNISKSKKGIPMSNEAKLKLSQSNTDIKQEIVMCPHCGKFGGHKTMPRWHFNNCKLRNLI